MWAALNVHASPPPQPPTSLSVYIVHLALQPRPACLVCLQAAKIWQQRGFSALECQALLAQLQAYSAGIGVFAQPWTAAEFSYVRWWQLVNNNSNEAGQLYQLAMLLFYICPHAADPERTFSQFGWFHTDLRNRLDISTVHMMGTVKQHLQTKQQAKAKCVWGCMHAGAC